MYFFLKKIIVCSCNLLFDFFVRYAILHNFVRQHYAGLQIMMTLLFECFGVLHNKNKCVDEVWYILITFLFAEKFKTRIDTNIFRLKKFIFYIVYLS